MIWQGNNEFGILRNYCHHTHIMQQMTYPDQTVILIWQEHNNHKDSMGGEIIQNLKQTWNLKSHIRPGSQTHV